METNGRRAALVGAAGIGLGLIVVWIVGRWDLPIALRFADDPSVGFGGFMQAWGRKPMSALLIAGGYVLASKGVRPKHPLLSQLAAAGFAHTFLHGGLITNLLKLIIGRPRPITLEAGGANFVPWLGFDPGLGSFSFPSGHVAVTMALAPCALILWRAGRRGAAVGVGVALVAWAGSMAYARVAYRAHYLSDVTASILIGLALAPISAWLGARFVAWLEARAARKLSAGTGA